MHSRRNRLKPLFYFSPYIFRKNNKIKNIYIKLNFQSFLILFMRSRIYGSLFTFQPAFVFLRLRTDHNKQFFIIALQMYVQVTKKCIIVSNTLGRIQLRVQIPENSVYSSNRDPMPSSEWQHNETQFIIGWHVENKSINLIQIDAFHVSENSIIYQTIVSHCAIAMTHLRLSNQIASNPFNCNAVMMTFMS